MTSDFAKNFAKKLQWIHLYLQRYCKPCFILGHGITSKVMENFYKNKYNLNVQLLKPTQQVIPMPMEGSKNPQKGPIQPKPTKLQGALKHVISLPKK